MNTEKDYLMTNSSRDRSEPIVSDQGEVITDVSAIYQKNLNPSAESQKIGSMSKTLISEIYVIMVF
jgi:hypothetical protein